MRRSILILLAVLAAVFAGPFPAVVAASSHATYLLTNEDDGADLTVHPGDTVIVRLDGHRQGGVTWGWSEPQSSDPAVLRKLSGARSGSGDSYAYFVAETTGTAEVSAVQNCRTTSPGTACAAVVYDWTSTVTVAE